MALAGMGLFFLFAFGQIHPTDEGEMILVKGGEFRMGSMAFPDEQPIREVRLDDFYIGKCEVTVKEYRQYCKATGTDMPPEPSWGWKDNLPIVNVTYADANNYAAWAGKRLPTEAEWEFAARGGNQSRDYRFSGGNLAGLVGWYFQNALNRVQPVGLRQANEIGIHDMSGNVWEWCADYYGRYKIEQKGDVQEESTGRRKLRPNDTIPNPKGPETGINRVLRGGSWFDQAENLRSANRHYASESHKDLLTGFRVAMDAPKE